MTFIHFIGIDISKNFFDVAPHAAKARSAKAKEAQHQTHFSNDASGYEAFCRVYASPLERALVVIEATGGYETALIATLMQKGIAVHRAAPRAASHFIRSLGKRAKTDALDAAALARYGAERHAELSLCCVQEDAQERLALLLARRGDLVAMHSAEQNRLKHPRYCGLYESLRAVIQTLQAQIAALEADIERIIENSGVLKAKKEALIRVKGVGKHTASILLGCMPELGTLTRRQAASLAGCAPHPRDSGKSFGYRHTIGGRALIKRTLFMAAMAARNFHPQMKAFYQRLIAHGKKPMVALTAVMRKIITILNAKIRDEFYAKT